jgi:hypothetical protein
MVTSSWPPPFRGPGAESSQNPLFGQQVLRKTQDLGRKVLRGAGYDRPIPNQGVGISAAERENLDAPPDHKTSSGP